MPINMPQLAAEALTGIPIAHQIAFQQVADAESCVIMSRAVGDACTELILEGYSSKGFHIKAKSCDWGPMRGFVVEDPTLSKKAPTHAAVTGQSREIVNAFHNWQASATPIYISDARKQSLQRDGFIVRVGAQGTDEIFRSRKQWSPTSVQVRNFVLRPRNIPAFMRPPNGNGAMWGVRYSPHDPQRTHALGNTGIVQDDEAVYAMVNPALMGGRAAPGSVRNAVTGDYDLFSLAAEQGGGTPYNPDVTDRRMIGVRQLEANINANVNPVGEDPHLGNMTGRHHTIRNRLNTAFRTAGYQGGNMVHHSDEAGRPFVNDVDLPVFAVVPGHLQPYGLSNIGDMREFIRIISHGHDQAGVQNVNNPRFVPFFNPGWMRFLRGY